MLLVSVPGTAWSKCACSGCGWGGHEISGAGVISCAACPELGKEHVPLVASGK